MIEIFSVFYFVGDQYLTKKKFNVEIINFMFTYTFEK